MADEDQQCRFCLESEPAHELIHPCHCRGSAQYVHRSCLDEWRRQDLNGSFLRCTECHYVYRSSRVWWGRLVSHWAPSALLSIGLVTGGGLLAGYGSSVAYNSLYYYLRNLTYLYPSRLQTIFHSCCWVGLPGLGLGLGKLLTEAPHFAAPRYSDRTGDAVVEMFRLFNRPPNTVHHYHHRDEEKKREHSASDSDSDSDSEDERHKVAPSQVAPYESKSGVLWCMLLTGVATSFYFSYRWVYDKALRWGASAQQIIENVH